MARDCFLGGCFLKITLMKNFEELKAVLSSTSTPVQSVFIVFP